MEFFLPEKGTQFLCTANGIPFSCTCSCKASLSGSTLLTVDARPQPTGICPILTEIAGGTPQKCRCQISSWMLPSRTCFVEGKALLTTASNALCSFGGMISVVPMVSKVVVGTGVSSVNNAEKNDFSWEESKGASDRKKRPEESKKTPSEEAPGGADGIPESAPSQAMQTAAVMTAAAVSLVESVLEDRDQEKQAAAILENMLCSGDCAADKREACPYYQDHLSRSDEEVTVVNDSFILGANYEEARFQRDDIDAHYTALKEEYGTTYWSYAAHHIISGGQVFKQEPEIVRLADFLHYDITNAENCIFLISKGQGYGDETKAERPISAYDAMGRARLQWHLGGHQYTLPAEELELIRQRIQKQTGQSAADIQSYADLLRQDMGDFKIWLRQHPCWYSRDETKQKALAAKFNKGMHKISQRIRRKLGDFTEKPSSSYPYYVSKEAYRYTFTLPKTEKCIIVRRTPKGIRLYRYRIRRNPKANDGFLILKPIEKDQSPYVFDLPLPVSNRPAYQEKQRQCIEFCDNIGHFLCIDMGQAEGLPFRPDFIKRIYCDPSEQENSNEDLLRVEKRQAELLTWFRDCQFEHYMSPVTMVRRRLKEWRELYG